MRSTVYRNISENRERILSLWKAAALPQGHGLAQAGTSRSRFTAPAEYLLNEEAERLLDWLLSEEGPGKARSSLREIGKLMAVQVLDPSEALGFIVDLKGIIRLVIGDGKLNDSQRGELNNLDKRIDQMMLLAFDEYAECRERIKEIKADEKRRLTQRNAQ